MPHPRMNQAIFLQCQIEPPYWNIHELGYVLKHADVSLMRNEPDDFVYGNVVGCGRVVGIGCDGSNDNQFQIFGCHLRCFKRVHGRRQSHIVISNQFGRGKGART